MLARFAATFVAALALFSLVPARAQVLPSGPILAAADLRQGQELDGEWNWSIDPFRTGQTGFHGGDAGRGQRRGDDLDVTEASAADPRALFEYDLDRSARAVLPGSWIGHDPMMRHYRGLVWYQRRFDAAITPGKRQFIRFGAADYAADVWLNGERLGRHEGGFTPFAFEVTGRLRSLANRLVVGVDSGRSDTSVPPPVTDWEDYGGITRPVRLIEVPPTFVDDSWIRLIRAGKIAADVKLDGPEAADKAISLRIEALGVVLTGRSDKAGRWHGEVSPPARMRRWSPEMPQLYDVAITAGADIWRDRVGFRTIAVKGTRILLNGKPVFLRGISIHAEELGENPVRRITPEAAHDLLALAKQGLGANFVRLAHYPHGEEMVRAADEMGLLVWSEIPVYWRIAFADPATLSRARAMLAENILRDRSRASVILWSVGNETPLGDARNAFLQSLVGDVRSLDPERLVTAALLTARDGNELTLADPLAASLDVMAVNTYNGWYSDDRLADLPRITWHLPTDKPLLISEFGADAKAGLHDTGSDPHKFSEEFQAEYYRQTLAMLKQLPGLAGMSPWILKDFQSPRRQRPGIQDGWNRKGLVSETGVRKQAFIVLADYYRAIAAAAP
jgi:beta-glucuronidase